jgi:hypothetical protein
MRWLRLVPVVLLGILGIAYVLGRPALVAAAPWLELVEFPLGAVVVALLVWAALARRRPEAPPVEWRRHEQVVRPLPDPAVRPYVSALERWLETGEDPASAADVLARARTSDLREQERLRTELAKDLSLKASRRKRESQLKKHLEGV